MMLILSRSYGLQCFATILDSWPLNVYLSIRFRGALFAGLDKHHCLPALLPLAGSISKAYSIRFILFCGMNFSSNQNFLYASAASTGSLFLLNMSILVFGICADNKFVIKTCLNCVRVVVYPLFSQRDTFEKIFHYIYLISKFGLLYPTILRLI